MTIAVCITTYNEEDSIYSLVNEFRRCGYPVYLVDDGSADDTVLHAFEADVTNVFQTGGGWGIGPSLMQAWRMALDNDTCETVIQVDAGGSHFPFDHYGLLERHQDGCDLVVGSRFIPGARYIPLVDLTTMKQSGRIRPWLSKLAAAMCNYAQSGSHIHDWTSGYRVFSRRCLEYLLSRNYIAKMHGWQIEVLAHAQARGFQVTEAPIVYRAGRSSFNWTVAREAFDVWLHVLNHIGWVGSNLDE